MKMSAERAAPLQLDKICRACLTQKNDMKPLYGAHLDEMLNSLASIQARHDDGLPKLMCTQCVLQCNSAYAFAQLCVKSDSILRKCTKPEFQESVTLIQSKIEVDESCVVDQYAEIAHDRIKNEIEPELVSDSSPKLDLHTNEQSNNNYNKLPQLVVRIEILRAAKPPPALKEHKCTKCDAIFAIEVDLKMHLTTHLKQNPYTCTVCSKTFARVRNLNRHAKIHLDKKPHQCDQCSMDFSNQSNLARHKNRHCGKMRKIVGKSHACSVCGKVFKWPSSLYRHMKYHTGKNMLSCNYCNRQFVEASNTGAQRVKLKLHVQSHTGERPYVCQSCGKAFSSADWLKVHQRLHTGEKPYKCKTCGKCFSVCHSLTIHARTHTNIKLHFCNICERGFSSSSHYSRHKKTHEGVKIHACNLCEKK